MATQLFTKDNIPPMKPKLSLQAQAAYWTAVAKLEGGTYTPVGTPIIGANVEIPTANNMLAKALGIDMDNTDDVLLRYGDVPLSPSPNKLDESNQDLDAPLDEARAKAGHDHEDSLKETEEPEMSITGMLDTIKDTPSLPLAIVGDAGTGKTSIIRQWAKDNGYELNLFLANTASEDDVAGAITPDHENKMAVAYPLEKLHRSTTHKTVLFLDELNTARREVQDPLLTLIQDRCLPNGTPLHPDTIIVTAINPSATYNNHEMSPQLRNRFMWFYHEPTEYDWAQWLSTTELGTTPAGKHIQAMVLDGTLKFDKDEAFTDERNEFTTPRSVYNLLKVSRGSITRLKALAETLVAPATAEAIRLHGYSDKDSRANSFFDERKKEVPEETKSEREVLQDYLKKMGLDGAYDITASGLDYSSVKAMYESSLKERHKVNTASTPSSSSNVYQEISTSIGNLKIASDGGIDALGGTTTDQAAESSLNADIQARLSKFGGGLHG